MKQPEHQKGFFDRMISKEQVRNKYLIRNRSKYKPHQGKGECERRLKQMNKRTLKAT